MTPFRAPARVFLYREIPSAGHSHAAIELAQRIYPSEAEPNEDISGGEPGGEPEIPEVNRRIYPEVNRR